MFAINLASKNKIQFLTEITSFFCFLFNQSSTENATSGMKALLWLNWQLQLTLSSPGMAIIVVKEGHSEWAIVCPLTV